MREKLQWKGTTKHTANESDCAVMRAAEQTKVKPKSRWALLQWRVFLCVCVDGGKNNSRVLTVARSRTEELCFSSPNIVWKACSARALPLIWHHKFKWKIWEIKVNNFQAKGKYEKKRKKQRMRINETILFIFRFVLGPAAVLDSSCSHLHCALLSRSPCSVFCAFRGIYSAVRSKWVLVHTIN